MSAIEQRSDEYKDRRNDLIEQSQEKRQEDDQAHSELLNAVAEGEEFEIENYEWVQLGNVDIEVKTWFPGDVIDKISAFSGGEIEPDAAQEAIRSTIEALSEMTETVEAGKVRLESEGKIRGFYKQYYQKWGDQGLEMAVNSVIKPAQENSDKSEAMESFRPEGRGTRVRGANQRRS